MLRVVLCNCPPQDAERIARALVESSHAACVNIIPAIRSVYRWRGQLCDEAESMLLIKTEEQLLGALEAQLTALHPYDVPEIVALEPSYVFEPYTQWALSQLRSK